MNSGPLSQRILAGPFQHPDHTQRGQRSICFNSQRLPVKIIDDIEQPEPSPVYKAIAHKVNAPHLIGSSRYAKGLFYSLGQSLLCSSSDIEFHVCVNPVNSFVIPPMTFVPKPVTTLPKTNSRMFGRESCQRFLNFTIVFEFCFILVSGSG